jgi:hypothetical protein
MLRRLLLGGVAALVLGLTPAPSPAQDQPNLGYWINRRREYTRHLYHDFSRQQRAWGSAEREQLYDFFRQERQAYFQTRWPPHWSAQQPGVAPPEYIPRHWSPYILPSP